MEVHVVDNELWAAFKKGDHAAFSQIYRLYFKMLYRYGTRIHPDSSAVQDAIQDMFVDLWNSREGLAHPDSVKYYLFRILRRKIFKAVSPAGAREEIDENTFTPGMHAEPFENSLMEAEESDYRSKNIQDALKLLPVRQQEAINLRYYHGFAPAQISEIMGISQQSVHNTLQKAMKFLRQILSSNMEFLLVPALILESSF